VEDARQAGGGQCNKREEGECETSRWRAMQGDRAANGMTRGGGWMPAIILKTTTATTMQNLHQRKQRNQGRYTPAPPVVFKILESFSSSSSAGGGILPLPTPAVVGAVDSGRCG
jgi:hypothetical protein